VRLRPPRQGDADDGHGLLLDGPGYDRWASLLHTGAVLWGAQPWWPRVPRADVRTPLWTRLAGPVPAGPRPARRPSLFADAGMALLRDLDTGRSDELWCRVDHGPHGYLSIAAHAHADALAVELRVGGVDVLADPGTYCYGSEPAWRAYFPSTLGHNTLEVGGVDQSVRAGPHLWTGHAKADLEHADGLDDGPVADWQATHRGYRRLRPPAVHRRAVRLDRRARRLVIEDRLVTTGAHDCRLAFHLGPGVACTLRGSQATLWWDGDGHRRGATLALPEGLDWQRLEGRTDPPAGWYSPAFDERVPATTLLGTGRVGHGQPLVTVLQLDSGSSS
jgi:Heparinase II/III-like protein